MKREQQLMRARADRVESLPNLGPKSAQMLRSAGIRTPAQLKKYGAVKAYTKVRAVSQAGIAQSAVGA